MQPPSGFLVTSDRNSTQIVEQKKDFIDLGPEKSRSKIALDMTGSRIRYLCLSTTHLSFLGSAFLWVNFILMEPISL